MNGATVSALSLISHDGTGSRAQVFPSDFLRRPTTSSVVTEENESIVVDAVSTMSGGLALDVSARISSTFLEKKRVKSFTVCSVVTLLLELEIPARVCQSFLEFPQLSSTFLRQYSPSFFLNILCSAL